MTTTATINHPADAAPRIAAQYIAVWNELDAKHRRALIDQTFTPDIRYVDPMVTSNSHAGIDAMIDAVQNNFPGLRFALRGKQDGHNNVARFSWTLGRASAEPVAYGTDVVIVAEDGRIQTVTGFLDAQS
jgi:SnoaL-like domain